jgi:hypothetical protein
MASILSSSSWFMKASWRMTGMSFAKSATRFSDVNGCSFNVRQLVKMLRCVGEPKKRRQLPLLSHILEVKESTLSTLRGWGGRSHSILVFFGIREGRGRRALDLEGMIRCREVIKESSNSLRTASVYI